MKKIIIVINNLATGGVQTSLRNMLSEIHNRYDVTVLCFSDKQEEVQSLPENVKILSVQSPFRHFGMGKRDVIHRPMLFVKRTFWWLLTKVFGRNVTCKVMSWFQKTIGPYDCAISFLHEAQPKSFYGGCNEFVLHNIQAKEKIGWIHCDFRKSGANTSASRKLYHKFDKIVACSKGTREIFVQCNPDLAEKTFAVRNFYCYDQIRSLAGNGVAYQPDVFNIVTVARLFEEKGIDRALEAIQYCVSMGHKIRYHIVGTGALDHVLKEKTKEMQLSDAVVFYGEQKNPFPYLVNADLFLLTSYHEAAPMVFDEAACLGVPVLTTQTVSTKEMIEESGIGFVCENTQQGINTMLLYLLDNREQLWKIRDRLCAKVYDNQHAIDALTSVLQ